MKELTILGLYRPTTTPEVLCASRVWTLNDWYLQYPEVPTPERLFNIHFFPHVHVSAYRFTGDWKAKYREAGARGTKIVVAERIEGIPVSCQEVAPIRSMVESEFFHNFPTCSIALMLQYAAYLGETRVRLTGVRLAKSEYEYQVSGIIETIRQMRERGISVDCREEREWSERKLQPVDWASLVDADVGSVRHIRRLYMQQVIGCHI